MSKTKNTVLAAIIIVVLLVASLIYSAVSQSKTDDILKNGVATTATPVRVESYGQSGMNRSSDTKQKYRAIFSFSINGSTYTVTRDDFDTQSEATSFLNEGAKQVRYLESNPAEARLVESPSK